MQWSVKILIERNAHFWSINFFTSPVIDHNFYSILDRSKEKNESFLLAFPLINFPKNKNWYNRYNIYVTYIKIKKSYLKDFEKNEIY